MWWYTSFSFKLFFFLNLLFWCLCLIIMSWILLKLFKNFPLWICPGIYHYILSLENWRITNIQIDYFLTLINIGWSRRLEDFLNFSVFKAGIEVVSWIVWHYVGTGFSCLKVRIFVGDSFEYLSKLKSLDFCPMKKN